MLAGEFAAQQFGLVASAGGSVSVKTAVVVAGVRLAGVGLDLVFVVIGVVTVAAAGTTPGTGVEVARELVAIATVVAELAAAVVVAVAARTPAVVVKEGDWMDYMDGSSLGCSLLVLRRLFGFQVLVFSPLYR